MHRNARDELPRRHERRSRLALVSLLLAVVLWTAPAHAYHTETDRQTDFSAFTLQQKQFRLGIFETEYGIFDSLMVGTYNAPWLLWVVLQDPALSAYAKWKFLDVGHFAMSARGTLFFFDLDDFDFGESADEGSFRATIVPLTLAASYVLDETWTVSMEGIWVQTFIGGDVTSDDIQALGSGAQNNFQLTLNGEYRLSRVTALNLLVRWAPFVSNANVNSTADVDAATTAELEASVRFDELENSWLIQPGVTFSWEWLNVQAAVGYGDLFIPGLRVVAPDKTIVPDLAVYARF
jgi:hypothetical protein